MKSSFGTAWVVEIFPKYRDKNSLQTDTVGKQTFPFPWQHKRGSEGT